MPSPSTISRRPLDRVGALRAEVDAVRTLAASLTDEEWHRPSIAKGWRVQEVVAHLAATCHGAFTPWLLGVMRSSDVEAGNDRDSEQRSGWEPARVLAEYERWSPRLVRMQAAAAAIPGVGQLRIPLGELGRFPLGQLASAFGFDHWTHLAHDIAPVLDRPAPGTDDNRIGTVVEWMLAGMEQMGRTTMGWVTHSVAFTLNGSGGDTWTITPAGGGLLRVRPDDAWGTAQAAAHITGRTSQFPLWGTNRRPWRDCDVTMSGDEEYATRFLDVLRIV